MHNYQQSKNATLKELQVDESKGLSTTEADLRLQKYGQNKLDVAKKISVLKIFIDQFKDILIVVLIFAASISLGLAFIEDESFVEPLLIYGIVVAIAIIGFFNEYKAERTIEALKKLVGQTTQVRRDGKVIKIEASELVPGDIVILEEGQKVPADIRLITANVLQVNEASLTGESVPTTKNTDVIKKEVALGDRSNMIFSGTVITTGSGEGVVTDTGLQTELGKIANLVNDVEQEETPMQVKLDQLGRKIGSIVVVVCMAVFLVIYLSNPDADHADGLKRVVFAFTAAVALAVAAIPEGLAFVVRISLALGARRMAAKNALVRRLSAVEALGSTNIICSDKTGTLTRGEMTVRKLWVSNQELDVGGSGYSFDGKISGVSAKNSHAVNRLLSIGLFCNNSTVTSSGEVTGDPTEAALIVASHKHSLPQDTLDMVNMRDSEIPFSSDRKMMSTIHKNSGKYIVSTKGAADVVLQNCTHILVGTKKVKLTPKLKKEVSQQNQYFASQALRVLGFAYKETSKKPSIKDAEKNLTFVGLQAMMDPPRESVKNVMHAVQAQAGMRVVMITGDHIETAKAVAREIGIEGLAIEGSEIDKLSEDEFNQVVESTSVYARVNPEHKIRIVQALKSHGYQVAMTGDGVNDAPAIKAADIGIAMGITGTDATKEAADLILLDDEFTTIIDAIEEGRGIFDNVRKFVNYLLSANVAEVISVLGGVLAFGKLIMSAAQLLFINIVTDGLPAVALGSDPAEKGIMNHKPQHYQGSIINQRIWFEIGIFGILMSAILLSHFWYVSEVKGDFARAVSVAFVSMVVYELVRLVGIRTDYKIKWFSNPWLSVAMLGSMLLLLAVIYTPVLANIFSVGPILAADWGIIAIGSLALYIFMKIMDTYLDHKVGDRAAKLF